MLKKSISIAVALLLIFTAAATLTGCASRKYGKKGYECPNKM